MIQELSLEKLHLLQGGLLKEAFDQAVEMAAMDCDDRPAHSAARTVTITVSLRPEMNGRDLGSVDGAVTISASLPKRELPKTNFNFRKRKKVNGQMGGMLVFNDMSEENAQQRTIDEFDKPTT